MDEKTQSGRPEISRINISQKYELQYWSKKLGVSHDELVKAVKAAGTSLIEVKKYLKVE